MPRDLQCPDEPFNPFCRLDKVGTVFTPTMDEGTKAFMGSNFLQVTATDRHIRKQILFLEPLLQTMPLNCQQQLTKRQG